jgi:hypothetical protein
MVATCTTGVVVSMTVSGYMTPALATDTSDGFFLVFLREELLLEDV